MQKYEIVTEPRRKVVEITCDKCGKVLTPEGDGIFEWQEAFCISRTGGYGSVFGDSDTWHLDLCQHCLHELIGPYVKYKEHAY